MTGRFFTQKNNHVEIERKFLLRQLPNQKPCTSYHIRQGYIARDKGNVVRVRQQDERYILSVKSPHKGLARKEVEIDIPKSKAETLFNSCREPLIEKTRKLYDFESHIWEVDFFKGPNDGLIIAEVELKSAKEKVILPPWIGPEVTSYAKFYNANLVQNPFKNWGISYGELLERMTMS